ncbi:uncharacterized protein HaLaN_02137, partial [Haematococcus lacustris]
DIRYERVLLKERKAEDHLFEGKEKFVTAAYRKKLEEDKKWAEEQQKKDEEDERNAACKAGHMANFYSNLLTKNVAMGTAKPPAPSLAASAASTSATGAGEETGSGPAALAPPPKPAAAPVAVDGSQMSERAAQVAARFCDVKRGDKLVVMHISDSHKAYLPRHLQPAHLKNYYHDLAAATKLGVRAEWQCREKDEGMSTCQTLTKMADRLAVDLLVLGSFGRKGEKLDMLGSVSDFSLRESAASLCIVRSTSSNFDRQAKFLFATDGSRAAALAFVMLVSKIRRAMDIVAVTMVSTTDGVVEAGYLEHYKASKCIPRRAAAASQVTG